MKKASSHSKKKVKVKSASSSKAAGEAPSGGGGGLSLEVLEALSDAHKNLTVRAADTVIEKVTIYESMADVCRSVRITRTIKP